VKVDALREAVCEANRELERLGLVQFTWGNVSGIDREAGLVVIKPSGVAYEALQPELMVVVDLEGKVVEGQLRASSDTATHLELYKAFGTIGGVCHTHSSCAVMWAQARRELPCFGTTHADYFCGAVPVTDPLREEEIRREYEANTGKVIVRRFAGLDPGRMPAVLVADHGPFTWGQSPAAAVENAAVLEEVAAMGLGTLQLAPQAKGISRALQERHYFRKHGPGAYYGQE